MLKRIQIYRPCSNFFHCLNNSNFISEALVDVRYFEVMDDPLAYRTDSTILNSCTLVSAVILHRNI